MFGTWAILTLLGSACGSDPPAPDTAAVQEIVKNSPPAQQQYVGDGVVTIAEREAAFLQFADCARQKGLTLKSYKLKRFGAQSWEFGEPDGMAADRSLGIQDECYKDFFSGVSALYTFLNKRDATAEAEFTSDVANCMRSKGANVSDGLSRAELAKADMGSYSTCIDSLDP